MVKLKHYQRDQIREWFCPAPGYVLDFSNKSFSEFFEDHFDINIYADAFSDKGTSKFNRLLSFIDLSPPHLIVELLKLLWSRKNKKRDCEIEDATYKASSDAWPASPEYVNAIMSSAAMEDAPFNKLLDEISSQPAHTILPHLSRVSAAWTLDTLEREFQRAFENLDSDPEAAVTASCSMVESVCRSILAARQIPAPKSLDIKSLYKAVREPLGLSPSKDVADSEVENDVRTILSGLSNAIQGIGALRTHSGTAHGRERGFRRLDPRIARLAVSASSALTLFLVETWEKRFPEDKLIPQE
ncbi:abortive infection family protein [Roseovarius nitratireducens]|uniref:abortive infection family protein n=1 Tax=Roseovarius nitratireducens TaxID=2044597 RepID=UPI000CE1915E|nr:abortive infection family protein [Roseovarius nitratireducens]